MTDAITPHEDARLTLHRHFGAGAPRVEAADCYRIVLRYINQQEKLSTRPSPEPSSKPGELAHCPGCHDPSYYASDGCPGIVVPREPAQSVDADEVDRVAEALCESDTECVVPWHELFDYWQERYRVSARAAIAALRSRPVVVDASFTRKEIEAAFDTAMRKCRDKGADAHQRDAIIAFGQDTLDALRSLVGRKA